MLSGRGQSVRLCNFPLAEQERSQGPTFPCSLQSSFPAAGLPWELEEEASSLLNQIKVNLHSMSGLACALPKNWAFRELLIGTGL